MVTKATLAASVILGCLSILYGIYCINGESGEEWMEANLKATRLAHLNHHLELLESVTSLSFHDDLISNKIDRINITIVFGKRLQFVLQAEGPTSAIPECVIAQILVLKRLAEGHRRMKLWNDLNKKYIVMMASHGLKNKNPLR